MVLEGGEGLGKEEGRGEQGLEWGHGKAPIQTSSRDPEITCLRPFPSSLKLFDGTENTTVPAIPEDVSPGPDPGCPEDL